MKILIVADFRLDSPHFLLNNPRMFSKGFVRCGHDVLAFSYRDMVMRYALFGSKQLAVRLGKDRVDRMLVEQASHYDPDIVFIAAFKLLDEQTLKCLRRQLPNAEFLCWYSDMYDGVDPRIAPIAKQCDWFLSSGGGAFLQTYKQLGISHCGFMPNPCDPDIMYADDVDDAWRADVVFTGKLRHGQGGQDPMRWELIETLREKRGLRVYGAGSGRVVKGSEYINAIRGAKIVISINAFNDVDKYHSDRLIHTLSCGSFTLAKTVPKSELLFEDKKHLRYFDSIEQCVSLIDEYLENEQERKAIAEAGMKHAHTEFGCEPLASHIIDLVLKDDYSARWREII